LQAHMHTRPSSPGPKTLAVHDQEHTHHTYPLQPNPTGAMSNSPIEYICNEQSISQPVGLKTALHSRLVVPYVKAQRKHGDRICMVCTSKRSTDEGVVRGRQIMLFTAAVAPKCTCNL
jgi:hypothetical protein